MSRLLLVAVAALSLTACGRPPPQQQRQVAAPAPAATTDQGTAADPVPTYRQTPIERAKAVEPKVMESKEHDDQAIKDSGG